MKESESELTRPIMLSRRRFVQGLAVGGVIAAAPNMLYANEQPGQAPEKHGKDVGHRLRYCDGRRARHHDKPPTPTLAPTKEDPTPLLEYDDHAA